MRRQIIVYLAAWLLLLALLGWNIAGAYLPLGTAHGFLPLGVAAIQVFIIMTVFMRLWGPPSLKWVFAGVGFYWLMILLGLSQTDYVTRISRFAW